MIFTCHLRNRTRVRPATGCGLRSSRSLARLIKLRFSDLNSMSCFRFCGVIAASAYSSGVRGRGRQTLSVRLAFAHPSNSRGHPPWPTFKFTSTQKRFFAASSTPSSPTSPPSPTPSYAPIRRSILSRILPASLLTNPDGTTSSSTSFRKIVALARPERRPLMTAIGLLLISSSVSLSIPFTVGRLIDYFTSSSPVSWSL
jgi:hypothetical protein